MFNCYVVQLAGRPFAYFKTEQAAENFCALMDANTTVPSPWNIWGDYIPGAF